MFVTQKTKFPKKLNVLAALLLQNIFTSTTVKNELRLNAKSVQNYSIYIVVLLVQLNFGVLIVTMLFASGNIAVIALFTNVRIINVRCLSKTLTTLIRLKKPYVK